MDVLRDHRNAHPVQHLAWPSDPWDGLLLRGVYCGIRCPRRKTLWSGVVVHHAPPNALFARLRAVRSGSLDAPHRSGVLPGIRRALRLIHRSVVGVHHPRRVLHYDHEAPGLRCAARRRKGERWMGGRGGLWRGGGYLNGRSCTVG